MGVWIPAILFLATASSFSANSVTVESINSYTAPWGIRTHDVYSNPQSLPPLSTPLQPLTGNVQVVPTVKLEKPLDPQHEFEELFLTIKDEKHIDNILNDNPKINSKKKLQKREEERNTDPSRYDKSILKYDFTQDQREESGSYLSRDDNHPEYPHNINKKKKETHYHQHMHMHEHDHQAEHMHKHQQQHHHSHHHGHHHQQKHEHHHMSYHAHQHINQHVHKSQDKHQHEHKHLHGHEHKNKQKHEHWHNSSHSHKGKHQHNHEVSSKHFHEEEGKHFHNHNEQHNHEGKHLHMHIGTYKNHHMHKHDDSHIHNHFDHNKGHKERQIYAKKEDFYNYI